VLRYYADLSAEQIASIMGITSGAVKSHTARAMSAMRSVLESLA
jgi:DNA-directed RNA polymerase specialized sigma24 family protein